MEPKRLLYSRRSFLIQSLRTAAGALVFPSWLQAAAAHARVSKSFVLVLLRGAADGLNICSPFQDVSYRKARPTLALAEPGKNGGVLDANGFFGFHPALQNFHHLYRRKEAAAVLAVGSPNPTRSHFDAQDFLENGTPGLKKTKDGWLNRASVALEEGAFLKAVGFQSTPARILTGSAFTPVLSSLREFQETPKEIVMTAQEARQAKDLSRDAEKLLEIQKRLTDAASALPPMDWGKPPLVQHMEEAAVLLERVSDVSIVFVSDDGWDHHSGESWRLRQKLFELDSALEAFARAASRRWGETVILVLTEFGRTVRENGAGGTDHGRAGVALLTGGALRGGRLFGRWPGLDHLEEGRDVPVTTDFRDLCGEILTRHLGLAEKNLQSVFPGHRFAPPLGVV